MHPHLQRNQRLTNALVREVSRLNKTQEQSQQSITDLVCDVTGSIRKMSLFAVWDDKDPLES